jgi:hypothetical protein
MDPVSRRAMWGVLLDELKGKSVVLTTVRARASTRVPSRLLRGS